MGCIYKLANLKFPERFYIGSTIHSIKKRGAELLRNPPNRVLLEDIMEYGRRVFKIEIIEKCENEMIEILERKYVLKLKPFYNQYYPVDRSQKYMNRDPRKAVMFCRISKDLKNRIEMVSDFLGMSANTFTIRALENYLIQQKGE